MEWFSVEVLPLDVSLHCECFTSLEEEDMRVDPLCIYIMQPRHLLGHRHASCNTRAVTGNVKLTSLTHSACLLKITNH